MRGRDNSEGICAVKCFFSNKKPATSQAGFCFITMLEYKCDHAGIVFEALWKL
jgi:hypothetical protein